jgi:hypothetical protein
MKQDSLARTIGRRLDSVKGQRANVRREEFDSGSQVERPRLSVFGLVTLPNRVNRLHEPDIPRSAGPPERPILDFAISVQNVPFGKVGQLQGETTFWRLADEHVRECKHLPVS